MYAHPPKPRWGLLILSLLIGLGICGDPLCGSRPTQTADSSGPGRTGGVSGGGRRGVAWADAMPRHRPVRMTCPTTALCGRHTPPPPLVLEDPPQPLTPKRPRTEADRDRLDALSLFAAARTHQRQHQYARALRLYQRALRYDPQSVTVVRAAISLAARLNHKAEAERYVRKAVEIEDPDPQRLERLGQYLFQVGNFSGAVRAYERTLAAPGGPHQSPDEVRLRMLLGRLYHALGEHGKAAESFARARHGLEHADEFGLDDQARKRLLGDPGLTYSLFGESFLLADRLDEAEAVFAKAHQLKPDQGRLSFNVARIRARRGEPNSALADLEECFNARLAGEGMAPYELLAEVLDDLGKKEELIGRLEKLRADDPKNVPLGYFLAEQYHKAQQLKNAESLYLELVKTVPVPTGYRRLVEIYRKDGRPGALLAVLSEVVEKTGLLETLGAEARTVAADADLVQSVVETARAKHQSEPKELSYHTRLAVALLALESKQFETAAEFFDLALQAKPDQAADVIVAWGVGLVLEEQAAQAAEVFQRGIDQQVLPEDDPRVYDLLAGALAMDKQTDEALAAAGQAVEKARLAACKAADEAVAADNALASARKALEKARLAARKAAAQPVADDETVAAARKALEKSRAAARKAAEESLAAAQEAAGKNEDLVRFSSRVAWVAYVGKRNEEALKSYMELIEEFDSDHTSNKTRDVLREARLVLSNLCVLTDDLGEAEEWLQQVLDEFPDDVGASNDLGYLWADQGVHLERALKMIRHAVDAEPDNVAYRDSLGWVFYRLGRHQEAVVELEKAAAAEDQPDPVILDHLGDALLKASQPRKAKQAWRRAVEAFNKREERQKAKEVRRKIEGND